jgi:hypothetical protein
LIKKRIVKKQHVNFNDEKKVKKSKKKPLTSSIEVVAINSIDLLNNNEFDTESVVLSKTIHLIFQIVSNFNNNNLNF